VSPLLIDVITSLDNNQVLSILKNPNLDKVNELPPVKPKGGEVFLVQSVHVDDWKCDQYTWINDSKCAPKNDATGEKLYKSYFKLRLPGFETKNCRKRPRSTSDFKKIAYWLESNPNLVLILYLGDEQLYQAIPHGNSKHETEFVRTMPSVVQNIKSKEGDPHKVTGV